MPSTLRMELRSSAGVVCIPDYWSIPAAIDIVLALSFLLCMNV